MPSVQVELLFYEGCFGAVGIEVIEVVIGGGIVLVAPGLYF